MGRPSKPDRAAALTTYLEGRILGGVIPAGYRIETVRELMGRFNISYSAAQQAVAELVRRGILTKSGRKILAGSSQHAVLAQSPRRINVYLTPTCVPENANRALHGMSFTTLVRIQQEALEHDMPLQTVARRFTAKDRLFLEQLQKECSGIIMIQELDHEILDLQPPIPMVGVMMDNDYDGRISLVDLDISNIAALAVRYFLAQGKKELAIVSDQRPIYRKRAELTALLWLREPGCSVRQLASGTPIEFKPGIGYLFTSDSVLQDYSSQYATAHDGGMLANDFTILGIDGKRLLDPDFHRFPTIAADWAEIGSVAFEECLALMNNPGRYRRRIGMPGRLVDADDQPVQL